MANNMKEVWGKYWEKRPTDEVRKHYWAKTNEIVLSNIPVRKSMKILDVGCGDMSLLEVIDKKRPRNFLVGLDIVRPQHSSKKKNFRFVLGDALKMPLKNETFDIVISNYLVEHFKDPRAMIREMVRTVKPEG